MRFLSFTIFLLISLIGQSQIELNVEKYWVRDGLPTTGDGSTFNEVYGYAQGGKEYGIIGSTMGAHIIDLNTDDSLAPEVAFIPGRASGPPLVHRDYHVMGTYLYATADQLQSSLQIIDLSQLPDTAIVVYDSAGAIVRAHNIFIDETTARLYVCGGAILDSGIFKQNRLAVYSLEDPLDPKLLIEGNDIPWFANSYAHDIYAQGDTAFIHAAHQGLMIADFSNPGDPQLLKVFDGYVEEGYNHSGWLHSSGKYYAMADETHGTRLKYLDISDLDNIEVVSLFGSEINGLSIAHNLIFKGDSLYVSYYADGVYVFDLSDPANPEVAAWYDTNEKLPDTNRYDGCWGVYPFLPSGRILISDRNNGLMVFDDFKEETFDFNDFSIYPNPFFSELYIDVPTDTSVQFSLEIVDVLGKQIVNQNLNVGRNIIQTAKYLSEGYYFASIVDGQRRKTVKLIRGKWQTQ